MIRFGERVTLTTGQTPVLRGFSPGIGKAFVEHDQPVLRQVNDGTSIGYGTRVWVDAPGFREVRDRDGARVGMVHQTEGV
jgi:hypothetical protein